MLISDTLIEIFVDCFQSYARSIFGRQRFIALRANVKAITIQRIVRGWLARCRFKKALKGFIKLQAHVRRIAAKKELKKLKVCNYIVCK